MNPRFKKAAVATANELECESDQILRDETAEAIMNHFAPLATAHDLAITTLESCLRDRTDGGLAIASALAALKGNL